VTRLKWTRQAAGNRRQNQAIGGSKGQTKKENQHATDSNRRVANGEQRAEKIKVAVNELKRQRRLDIIS